MRRILIAFLLSCLSNSLLAAPPNRIEAHYDVLKGGIRIATMTETFTRQQDHYALESISQAVWPLTMFKAETIWVNSSGAITAQGLRPATYTSKRKVDEDRNTRADLDWKKREITLKDKAGERTLPLPAGTQDRLSAMYQLMFLPLRDMTVLKFYMTNGSKVDDYNFVITHDQSVTVPLGTFNAVYLATPAEKNVSRTEIWVVTGNVNFPYKLVITEQDGGQFTQVLTGIDFSP
jgi:hypothetical protein